MVYILGNPQDARIVARREGLEHGEWILANHVMNLRGLNINAPIIITWGANVQAVKWVEGLMKNIKYRS